MASCPQCYTLLPEGATVCPSCGAPISIATEGTGRPTGYASPGNRIRKVPSPPRAPGFSVPAVPSVPLIPGESVVGRFSSDPGADARVIRMNDLVAFAVLMGIFVPILVITAVRYHLGLNLGDLILVVPIVFVTGMILLHARKARRNAPTVAYVTDRRIIVERLTAEPTSAVYGLDNVGDVRVMQGARIGRRAGVAWVSLLPVGTTDPFIGSGENRRVAPGVVWIPALPLNRALQMREAVLRVVRDLRTRLGSTGPFSPPISSGKAG
jgi:hypothetical protein